MKTMDSELQDACHRASMNARSLEEMMLTFEDVVDLQYDQITDVLNRCNQIIDCMNKLQEAGES